MHGEIFIETFMRLYLENQHLAVNGEFGVGHHKKSMYVKHGCFTVISFMFFIG